MLVAGLLVVVVLKSWLVCFLFFDVFWGVVLEGGGGQKTTTGLWILFLGGVETTASLEGWGVQTNNNRAAVFVSRMW